MTTSSNILARTAQSASYNMILQVMFRVMTFVLNAFILKNKYVTEDMLGVVNVRLMLLYSTILFLAREAFRKACLSQTNKYRWQQVVNLVWFSFPLGVLCATILGYVWSQVLTTPDPQVIPRYHLGVLCFAVSAVLELLAEPFYVVGQALLFVRLKVMIEGLAVAGRCILTVLLVVFFPQLGIIAFCIAQLSYSIIFYTLYLAYFINFIRTSVKKDDDFPMKSIREFFPQDIENEDLINEELSLLTWSFFKQGFLKQLLTEGERYIMTLFNVISFADQGIYDVINNLGSLAARFIFLPIEESGYLFFGQTVTRNVSFKEQEKEAAHLAVSVLQSLLKFVVLIGTIIFVFGDAYSFLLLDIYAGSLLSSEPGPTLLKWFSFYVLVIAINGTTECFVFAAMSQKDVDRYNFKMLLFSFLFLMSSWYLTKTIGSVGFILANCLNMGARILHSIYFIWNYFHDSGHHPLKGLIPSIPVIVSFIASWFITNYSEAKLCCDRGWLFRFLHIGIGGACLLGVLITILITERDFIAFVLKQWRSRGAQKEGSKEVKKENVKKMEKKKKR